MDSGVSLLNFDFQKNERIARCAFLGGEPLVYQPLIQGKTWPYRFLNSDGWRNFNVNNHTNNNNRKN